MLDLDKIEEPVDLFEGQDLEVILTDIIETNNTLVCLPKEAPEYIMGQSEDSLPCFDFSHYISSKWYELIPILWTPNYNCISNK